MWLTLSDTEDDDEDDDEDDEDDDDDDDDGVVMIFPLCYIWRYSRLPGDPSPAPTDMHRRHHKHEVFGGQTPQTCR